MAGTSLLKAMFVNTRFHFCAEGPTCEVEVPLEANKLESGGVSNLEIAKSVESG